MCDLLHSPGCVHGHQTWWLGPKHTLLYPLHMLSLEHRGEEGCYLIGCRPQTSTTFRQDRLLYLYYMGLINTHPRKLHKILGI